MCRHRVFCKCWQGVGEKLGVVHRHLITLGCRFRVEQVRRALRYCGIVQHRPLPREISAAHRLVVHHLSPGSVGQEIGMQDIGVHNGARRRSKACCWSDGIGVVVVVRTKHFEHADAGLKHVVFADVHAVDRCQRTQQPVLVAGYGFHLAQADARQFAAQDFFQEVARATCRFKKFCIHQSDRPGRKHVRYQIQHGVDLTLMCKDLSKIPHTLARLDLAAQVERIR